MDDGKRSLRRWTLYSGAIAKREEECEEEEGHTIAFGARLVDDGMRSGVYGT